MRMHNNIRKPRMKMGRPRPQLHDNSHNTFGLNQDRSEKIDSRCRHNSQYLRQFVDKYLNFARESISSGDRIAAEGFFQHADHYQRLLNEKIQERAAAEKAQRELMESQSESRNIYPVDAEGAADSTNAGHQAKKPTTDNLVPAASDADSAGQSSEQIV